MEIENQYKYKFSIIMSIYNVEEYLEEAIDSIIRQNIGFEENVQLILVNDGSPDNSEQICLQYKEKYPNNIVYVSKANGGLSSAKNFGLQYREGKYINFCDPDDILSNNTLEEVYNFFEENYNAVSMVAIPLCFFEAQKGMHPKYKYMGSKNRVINLDIEPYNFILSGASAFYKTEIFEKLKFDERMVGEEDTKLNCQIYETERCFGYVCEKGVKYNYRKRNMGGSIVDNSTSNIETFYAVIYLLEDVLRGKSKENLHDYLKELILYETRSRLKKIEKELLGDKYDYIIEKYKYYLSFVDDKYIIKNSRWIKPREQKYFYLSNFLQDKGIYSVTDNGFVNYKGTNLFLVNDTKILINDVKFNKENIEFKINFYQYNISDVELVARSKTGKVYKLKKQFAGDSPYSVKFGIHYVFNTVSYTLELPYKRQKIEFYVRNKTNKKLYKINNIEINKYCKFALKDREIRMFYKDYNIKFNKTEFAIKEYKYPSLKYNLFSYKHIKSKYKYKAIYRLINRKNKKYILISDRPEKAGDNGEAIFRYINENERKIAKNTYFAISPKSKDYKRLKKIGNVVKKDSIKHKILFMNSKVIMSSHMGINFYTPFQEKEIKYYRDMLKYKFIWLQHGITKDDISGAANKYRKGIDYIVVATNGEQNEFKKKKYSYNKDDIIFSGFPRYDYLKSNEKNIITIAPTWRAYLSGEILSSGYHEVKTGFEESEYYNKYKNLLTNLSLQKLLKDNNYKLKFLLHPGMVGYTELFKKFSNEHVEIINVKDINYSEIFAESKLLITDYSSVFFDFSYLKKPIIYYQFDKEEFFKKHYKQGYFDYEIDGLGSVTYTEEELLNRIEDYFKNNFTVERKYLERIDKTFKYNDKENCKRLVKFLKKRKVLRNS